MNHDINGFAYSRRLFPNSHHLRTDIQMSHILVCTEKLSMQVFIITLYVYRRIRIYFHETS